MATIIYSADGKSITRRYRTRPRQHRLNDRESVPITDTNAADLGYWELDETAERPGPDYVAVDEPAPAGKGWRRRWVWDEARAEQIAKAAGEAEAAELRDDIPRIEAAIADAEARRLEIDPPDRIDLAGLANTAQRLAALQQAVNDLERSVASGQRQLWAAIALILQAMRRKLRKDQDDEQ